MGANDNACWTASLKYWNCPTCPAELWGFASGGCGYGKFKCIYDSPAYQAASHKGSPYFDKWNKRHTVCKANDHKCWENSIKYWDSLNQAHKAQGTGTQLIKNKKILSKMTIKGGKKTPLWGDISGCRYGDFYCIDHSKVYRDAQHSNNFDKFNQDHTVCRANDNACWTASLKYWNCPTCPTPLWGFASGGCGYGKFKCIYDSPAYQAASHKGSPYFDKWNKRHTVCKANDHKCWENSIKYWDSLNKAHKAQGTGTQLIKNKKILSKMTIKGGKKTPLWG